MPKQTDIELVAQDTLTLQAGYGFWASGMRVKLKAVRFASYSVVKRILDLVLAAGLLVVLSPVLLVTAIAVKLDSPGPVLFKQERVGREGRVFKILKFRSMVADNDVSDNSCEDKYTRLGKVLRRTSLDELPQLFNVLVGQMSFIGPRPWILDYWTNMSAEERERGRVRPGITGLAAAKGRNGLSVFQKIAYDLEYVRNYSLWQDVKIIFMTMRTVLKKEVVDAGKSGIRDDIGDLKKEVEGPKARIVVKTDPLVSVVVSLGNGEEYIKEVVSSALGRTCKRIELVVANDNYAEEARQIMRKFSPDKIKVVSRRGGEKLDGAEGRFLCFVDMREAWRPGKIGEALVSLVD